MEELLNTLKVKLGFGLKRELGFWMLLLLGIGAVTGAGIFVLLGLGAELAGPYLPLSFAVGGGLALLIALMYAEIATTYPESGATLQAIGHAFGRGMPFFLISWLVILGDISYLALNAMGFALYLAPFVPIAPLFLAIGGLFLVALINLRGIKNTGVIEAGLTLLVVLFFVALIVVAGDTISLEVGFLATTAGLGGNAWLIILAGAALIYSGFIGYEDIVSVAGEAKNPHRTLPAALIVAVLLVTGLYIGLSFVLVHVLPAGVIAETETPLLALSAAVGIPGWTVVVAAILAATTTLVAGLLVTSRKIYALSEKGYFKRTFTKLNVANVPARAILATTLVVAMLVLTGSVEFVAYTTSAVFLISVIATAVAALKVRIRPGFFAAFRRIFHMPLFPLIPAIVIVLSGLLLLQVDLTAILALVVWTIVGIAVFLLRTPALEKAVEEKATDIDKGVEKAETGTKEAVVQAGAEAKTAVEDKFHEAGDKLAETISGPSVGETGESTDKPEDESARTEPSETDDDDLREGKNEDESEAK